MKLRIVSVGKIKEPSLKSLIDEYVKRLSGYVKLEMTILQDEPIPKNGSSKEEDIVKQKEGQKILNTLQKDEYIILLDLQGKEIDSLSFADKIEHLQNSSLKTVTFVIGGSLGLSDEVRKKANESLSLSKMTFTHQMSKVLLLEQIYRAFKINNNEVYHK